MTQLYDAYGRPVRPQKSSAGLVIGLLSAFGLILLLTLYLTGALDRMFGTGTPASPANTMASTNAAAPAAAAPAPAPAPAAPAAAPAPAPAPTKAAAAPPALTGRFMTGAWCEGSSRFEFDLDGASNMIANGSPGTAVLRGDQLTMDDGSGGGGLTVTIRVNSQNSVTWVYPSGVADRLRRC